MPQIQPKTPENAGSLAGILDQWRQGMRVAGTDDETDGQFVGLLAHRPELLETVLAHYATLLQGGEVSTRLKEFLRIAVADAIGCSRYCTNIRLETGRQAGVTEADIQAVRARDGDRLDASELAAVRFAERFVADPLGLDNNFDELRSHFSDTQIVEIGVGCATFMGFGNMVVAFGLQAGPPDMQIDNRDASNAA